MARTEVTRLSGPFARLPYYPCRSVQRANRVSLTTSVYSPPESVKFVVVIVDSSLVLRALNTISSCMPTRWSVDRPLTLYLSNFLFRQKGTSIGI